MLRDEIRQIKHDPKTLRRFGSTLGCFFALLGGVFLWRQSDAWFYFSLWAVVFLFFGLAFPGVLRPVHRVWMTMALLMGWVMSRVILMVVFYFVLTPVAVVTRVLGKDFLGLRKGKEESTYWLNRERDHLDKRVYEQQY